jgi:hypothetical protein
MEPQPPPAVERHPIEVVVEDDLHRSRLTVFFRLLLLIPHLIWLLLWSIGALVAVVIDWFATLLLGRSPQSFHNFLSAYVRYTTHVYAYFFLVANPWPGFLGEPGSYPVDVEIAPPERQARWKTLFRIPLAFPALMVANILTGGWGFQAGGGRTGQAGSEDVEWWGRANWGVLGAIAFLGWFVCLLRGQMPQGFRDLGAYGLRYGAQTWGYLLLLTDRYPNSDPATPPAVPPADEPTLRLRLDDDRRRSRLTVLFRFLLFLPHLVWYLLWTIALVLAVIAAWFATLALGRAPHALHQFIAAYVRYEAHLWAFLFLIANPFPSFTGAPGVYPLDLEIDPPARQSRWKTLFRIFLAVPALIVSSALNSLLVVAGILGWFVSLALARMPEGLRNLGAFSIRYTSQVNAYLFLLTDRYPYSGPWEFARVTPPEAEPEVAAA